MLIDNNRLIPDQLFISFLMLFNNKTTVRLFALFGYILLFFTRQIPVSHPHLVNFIFLKVSVAIFTWSLLTFFSTFNRGIGR